MKIAICISGLPRTGAAAHAFIQSYFDLGPEHTVDYFCHTWDTDSIKNKNEGANQIQADITILDIKCMLDLFSPITSKIDPQSIVSKEKACKSDYKWRCNWLHLFYSMMQANHLKRKHEMENNFKYDVVVKIRYDTVFEPDTKFKLDYVRPRSLYTSHLENFNYEYHRKNFSDVVFYGNSNSMDIACDYFRFVMNHMTNHEDFMVGPGVGMHKYLTNLNVTPERVHFPDVILRPEALNDLTWDNILKIHRSYYE